MESVVVDLEGRANPGRKISHGELEEGTEVFDPDQFPEVLEMRYLKARRNLYTNYNKVDSTEEASRFAEFKNLPPDHQAAMIKHLEHNGSFMKAVETFGEAGAKIGVALGILNESALEDLSFSGSVGTLMAPIIEFLPEPISNIIHVISAVAKHWNKDTSIANANNTYDPKTLMKAQAKNVEDGEQKPIPSAAVVDLDQDNGSNHDESTQEV